MSGTLSEAQILPAQAEIFEFYGYPGWWRWAPTSLTDAIGENRTHRTPWGLRYLQRENWPAHRLSYGGLAALSQAQERTK